MIQKNSEKAFPVIDVGRCSLCQGCVSIAPSIFFLDENTGRMSVTNLENYPEELVDDAIRNCPRDCISWDTPITIICKKNSMKEPAEIG